MIRRLRKKIKIFQHLLWYFFLFVFVIDAINIDDYLPGASLSHVEDATILMLADPHLDGFPITIDNDDGDSSHTLLESSKKQLIDFDSLAVSAKFFCHPEVQAYFSENNSKLLPYLVQFRALYIDNCSLLI